MVNFTICLKKIKYPVAALCLIMAILYSAGCSNSFKLLEYLDGTAANIDPSEEDITLLDPILTLSPANPEITISETINFSAAGGTEPYQYYDIENLGEIVIDTGEFTPDTIGEGTIRAEDAEGMLVETKLKVTAAIAEESD